jgi:hypothetical protein
MGPMKEGVVSAPLPASDPSDAEGQPSSDSMADERLAQVLAAEYGLLTAALGAAWSASLTRTSLFLFSLSASGVALGFAAQGGVSEGPFRTFALVVLPVVLFIGVATFVRVVQVQREATVYVTGLNRIRHFMAEAAPDARRFFVLPIYDDQIALFRSIGTGMSLQPPRSQILYLVVQTQGMVGVVTAAVAAAFVGLLVSPVGDVTAWLVAALTFVAVVVGLFAYWQRSLRSLQASIRSEFPTPPEEYGAPI